jgi:hypothetical protein
MRGTDVFYQLRYFLSLNDRNAYIQRDTEGGAVYFVTKKKVAKGEENKNL